MAAPALNVDDLPEYVYRVMRADLEELVDEEDGARFFGIESHHYKFHLLQAVAEGSRFRSPWLHVSGTLEASHSWGSRALARSPEQRGPRVRIPLRKLLRDGTLARSQVHDLRNAVKYKETF